MEYLVYDLVQKERYFSFAELSGSPARLRYGKVDQFSTFISPYYSQLEIRASIIHYYRNTLYGNPFLGTAIEPNTKN